MSTDRRAARFGPLDEPREFGRSHYPPIADYAYVSDCESNGLIAPSGNVEWLCIPRPDSPSVFGAILDRSAGGFRFGPADVLVPAARRYIPGTMVVETSWNTATGWAIVRDTLLMGPWHHDNTRDSTHKRAPTDYDAEHILLRTVRCVNGEVQMTIDCEPVFDYGQAPRQLGVHRRRLPPGRLSHRGVGRHADAHLGHQPRLRGAACPRPDAGQGGRDAFRRPVVGPGRGTDDVRRGVPPPGLDGAPLAALARTRPLPGPSVACVPGAFGAHPQGPHLCPERRDHRRRHDVAPRDSARRTELGLPLQLDPRLNVRAVGPVHARFRLGSERLHELRGRRCRRAGRPAGDVRRRR